MSGGTVLIGVSGYVFLAVVGRALADDGPAGAATAAALASLYLLSNIVGPGLFVAIEQETSRRTSAALAGDRAPAAVVRRTATASALMAVLVVLLLTAAQSVIIGRAFGDDAGLLVALGVAVAGSAWVFWLRGVAGGYRDFRWYGRTLVLDAAIRLVGAGTLGALGVRSGVAYGLVLCGAPLLTAVVTAGRRPGRAPSSGGPADAPAWRELGRSVGALATASTLSMAMANLVPVIFGLLVPGAPALVFAFAGAVVLTRAPLLVMAPIQAVLLPSLSAAASQGRWDATARTVRLGLLVVTGVTAVFTAGCALLGRSVVALVYGPAADLLSAGTLTLLGVAAGLLMAVLLLQPVLLSLDRHTGLLVGWAVGAALFAAGVAVPLDPLDRALTAQLLGPAGVLAVHLWCVRAGLRTAAGRRRRRTRPGDVPR